MRNGKGVDLHELLTLSNLVFVFSLSLMETSHLQGQRGWLQKWYVKYRRPSPWVNIMMMTATAASNATASATTTTSGLGVGLGSDSWSKNSPTNFKLISCCFFPISYPHTKFHPNRTKNIEVKKIRYYLALVGRSDQSKNSCSHLKLNLCCF